MNRFTITIELEADADTSTILDWAQMAAQDLASNCEGEADEDLVSVTEGGAA